MHLLFCFSEFSVISTSAIEDVFEMTYCMLVTVCSSHIWTGTGSAVSVIWSCLNRTESGTRYILASDCYLLTFYRRICRVHALTVWQRKIFMLAVMWITSFFGWCEVQFIWNKHKQHSKCSTWTESSPENVPRPNRSDVGPESVLTLLFVMWDYVNYYDDYYISSSVMCLLQCWQFSTHWIGLCIHPPDFNYHPAKCIFIWRNVG